MAGISSESALEWLNKDRDEPIVQHIHSMCALQGKTIEDIAEVLCREFVYEGPPDGDWKTYVPSRVGDYTLTFTDMTNYHQYWHFVTKTPIAHDNVKVLIDWDRLEYGARAFLEADLGLLQKQTGTSDEKAETTTESSDENTYSDCREQAY